MLPGVIGASFLAAAAYHNDMVLRSTFLIGNHFPIGVFGPLILLLFLVNPVLRRLRPRWRLRPSELAVALALSLPGLGTLALVRRRKECGKIRVRGNGGGTP